MTNIITTIGWFGFLVAGVYFMIYDRMGAEGLDYVRNTKDILMGSGALVVGGYILKSLSKAVGVGTGNCRVCKKRIPKSEMFCFDHSREKIWGAKERTRDLK